MRKPRGDNQEKILDFIKQEIATRGYAPSVREICDAVGLKSTSTVHGHLMRLQKRGLIHRDAMKPRAMDIIDDEMAIPGITVPVLGRVTAGVPILAQESIEEYVSIPPEMLSDGKHFILGVRGESMIQAGIMDGDYIVVHQQPDAVNGDIVVAMIDGEATVKRYYKENGTIRLQPENPTMKPIYAKNAQVLGKVISLYRILH
ncbi:MAG: transcriptional repressor LexA [Eubacteriales bacterium]|nr:transcriptional repressor LexA [Eubacteriales bacterium]MDD3881571.1 transcriptional repressor LexA [Eubacteriales bacterium]MDD4513359.1 transcriptional repressor LexA [Eubacteriales bacterium]